ncbi:MAG: sensor histidine kinase [Oligoflexia bacterium]|nr:sensor histidine kinase [Oligoflexia bacterium]
MPSTDRIAAACGIGCVVFGLLAAAHCAYDFPISLNASMEIAPIQFNGALCLAMLGVMLVDLTRPLHRFALPLGCAVGLLSGITLLEYILATDLKLDELLVSAPPFAEGSANPGRMAPNFALACFLAALSPLLLHTKLDRTLVAPLIGILGVVLLGIGGAAFFGHIAGVEAGYGWGKNPPMSLSAGSAVVILGLGVEAISWLDQEAFGFNPLQIWRSITLHSTLGVLVIALVTSCLAVLPFYQQMTTLVDQKVADLSQNSAEAIGDLFKEMRANARFAGNYLSFSGRTISRDLGSPDPLWQSLRLNLGIEGFARLNEEGHPVVTIGQGLPEHYNTWRTPEDGVAIEGPIEVNRTARFLMIHSYRAGKSKKLVTDFFLTNTDKAKAVLRRVPPQLDRVELFFATPEREIMHLFKVDSESSDLTLFLSAQTNQVAHKIGTRAQTEDLGIIKPLISAAKPSFVAYARIPETGAFVVAVANARRLYQTVNFQLGEFFLGAVGLALLGSLSIFFMVRRLVNHAQELQLRTKQDENRIRHSLKEKEILLREIHHRVKNNLQVISSVLKLQSRELPNGNGADVFDESQSRIRSISLLHELLYRGTDLGNVDFQLYCERLCAELLRSHGMSERVTPSVHAQGVTMDLERAIPFGMLINEIVTNSLNHAFPDGRHGTISLSIEDIGTEGILLVIKDDGIGFQSRQSKPRSLGLRLIDMLAKQLDGTVDLDTTTGVSYRIVLAYKKPRKLEEVRINE